MNKKKKKKILSVYVCGDKIRFRTIFCNEAPGMAAGFVERIKRLSVYRVLLPANDKMEALYGRLQLLAALASDLEVRLRVVKHLDTKEPETEELSKKIENRLKGESILFYQAYPYMRYA